MAKAKLKVDAPTLKKLPAAADLVGGVGIGDMYKASNLVHVEVSARSPEKFYELGFLCATISDDELSAFEKRKAAKAQKISGNSGK